LSAARTIDSKPDLLQLIVRAYTKGMKYTHEKPDETRRIVRAHFPELDDTTFEETYRQHIRGVPTTPVLTAEQYRQSLLSINYAATKQLDAPYEKAFYPKFAIEAARAILG